MEIENQVVTPPEAAAGTTTGSSDSNPSANPASDEGKQETASSKGANERIQQLIAKNKQQEAEIGQLRELAKSKGLDAESFKQLAKEAGYVTKEEIEVEKRLDQQFGDLSRKYPDFDRIEVMKAGAEANVFDPEKAYFLWKGQQAAKGVTPRPAAELDTPGTTANAGGSVGERPLSLKDGSLQRSLAEKTAASMKG